MSMIWEYTQLALSSLKSNKMRALLTMLGIIIGIMSIITIVIIGDVMTSSVTGSLSALGSGNLTVSLQEKDTGGEAVEAEPESKDMITGEMVDELQAQFPNDITGVSLSHSAGTGKAQDKSLYANVSVQGTNADYFLANDITLLSGRLTSGADVDSKSRTAVVSDKLVSNMFPGNDSPIGEQIRVYGQDSIEVYTIIGVYKYESSSFIRSTASDKDLSTVMYIPISTAKLNVLEKNYTNLTVILSGESDVPQLTGSVQAWFDGIYSRNDTWRVSVSNMESMLDTINETLNTISLAIAFIAGISLVVGGIGVMNIMLVSVTERTREIGTRKALGARNVHIQFQFVMEALIISLIGGIIGLGLGVGLGALIAYIFGSPLVVSTAVVVASVLFSMVIGIFFGLYPANKAAKLDPIDALRYE